MGAATSVGQKQGSSPQIPLFMIEAHKKHMRPLYISQGRRGKINYTTYIEDIPIMAETLPGLEALYIKVVKEIPRQPINATRRNNRSGPNISKPTNQTARSPGIGSTVRAAGRGAATAVASAAQTVRNKARRVGTDKNGNPTYGIDREFRAAGQQAAAAARVAAQATATGVRGVARGASAAAGMAARGVARLFRRAPPPQPRPGSVAEPPINAELRIALSARNKAENAVKTASEANNILPSNLEKLIKNLKTAENRYKTAKNAKNAQNAQTAPNAPNTPNAQTVQPATRRVLRPGSAAAAAQATPPTISVPG